MEISTANIVQVQVKDGIKLNSFKGYIFWYHAFASINIIALAPQQTDVSGTLIDTSGSPMPGASVVVKGTNNGTINDFDGMNSILAEEGNIFEFPA